MRIDKSDRLVGAVCHALDNPPIAVAEDGSERRFHLPEMAHRAQKGRKALKRFKAVELVARSKATDEPPPSNGSPGSPQLTLC